MYSFLNGNDAQVFLLKGYAGTGKTTLLKGVMDYLDAQKRNFMAMAPLTVDNHGENFTDLFDLFTSGAQWFGHGNSSIQNVDLMSKCLQYLQSLPATLVSRRLFVST